MKKIVMLLLLLPFIFSVSASQKEEDQKVIIASNTDIDFSSLPNLVDHAFTIINGSFDLMIEGDIDLLLSDKKWTDEQMADYKQRYNDLPLVLTIVAFSDQKEASPALQAEIFSMRAGDKLLYLYISNFTQGSEKEAIALYFSEDAQTWFSDHDLMAIPDVIKRQNRVELGLIEPMFAGGYK